MTTPLIPAVTACIPTRIRKRQLIWVKSGSARVSVGDVDLNLTAGDAAWIPPDTGESITVSTTPGSVVFPIRVSVAKAPEGPDALTMFRIHQDQQDWMTQHFSLQVTIHPRQGHSARDLLQVLGTSTTPDFGDEPQLPPPLVPQSDPARSVARELLADPCMDWTVEQWASSVFSSPRTLRRDFLSSTGLTFEKWRLRCRLSAAVSLIQSGYEIGYVASLVGFTSHSGFSRAFRRETGISPRDYLYDGTRNPPIPSTQTPFHSNPHHVLTWMYRGSGALESDTGALSRPPGSALLLPANSRIRGTMNDGAIVLPLGNFDPVEINLPCATQIQFPPAWEDYLLHSAVAARSWLKPEDHDPHRVLELFRGQLEAQLTDLVPIPSSPDAAAAATEFLRHLGTSAEPILTDLAPTIRRCFTDELGLDYPRWRTDARMRLARSLLSQGVAIAAVSRRVRYTHPGNFSRVFRRNHGLSPSAWRQREGY